MSKSRAKRKQRRRPAGSGRPAGPAAPQVDGADGSRPAAQERRPRAVQEAGDRPQRRSSRLDVRAGVPRPDAIWAPFPLTELGMAVGLLLFGIGFFGSSAAVFLAGLGVLLVVVGELCLREHFAGFRSHSILLALLPVTIVHLGVVYLGSVTWRGPLALGIDLAVTAALAWWLQRRFVATRARPRARRAGG